MKSFLAFTKIYLKLAARERAVLFFNYFFPLIFFFLFGQVLHAEQGSLITQVVTMTLVIGILGSGLFGAGIRAVQERETNVLRRFKVAPISPAPILASSIVLGWLLYLPAIALVFVLSHLVYGMPYPERWLSLLVLASVGMMAFRSLGLIIASVVNSAQESQVLVQIFYLPMLFLSGTTIPLSVMPDWLRLLSQFIPASYLFTGMQGILLRHETIAANVKAVVALLLTAVLAAFISFKLFRWEKEEKIALRAKLWLVGVLLPFVLLGTYQAYSHEQLEKVQLLDRDLRRNRTLLIRNSRIFVGDGQVIESGSVLIRKGKVEQVFAGTIPDPESLKAEPVEASGKTLLPGLIDTHVHLMSSAALGEQPHEVKPEEAIQRRLATYLYSGVTAVKSAGDPLDILSRVRARSYAARRLGAALFYCGPVFTAERGHGTEYFRNLPESVRKTAERQTVRTPKTAEEARRQVDELKAAGVDGIKVILEPGQAGMLFNRLDSGTLVAISEAARAQELPVVVHTAETRDVVDALDSRAQCIEHGSFRDRIPDELLARMARQGTAYDPTLSVGEAFLDLGTANPQLLKRSLVEQVSPPELLRKTLEAIQSPQTAALRKRVQQYPIQMDLAMDNLRRAYASSAMLVTGTDSGNFLVFHGSAIHRELQLWVKAGIPPKATLQAATWNAARLLGVGNHMGLIRRGYDADLLLVDGNPLEDISLTERISAVFFKGERVNRAGLLAEK